MCQVSPEHVSLLSAFGALCVGGAMLSVFVGRTYWRGVINRDAQPFEYWSAVAGMMLIGGLCLGGLALCPRG